METEARYANGRIARVGDLVVSALGTRELLTANLCHDDRPLVLTYWRSMGELIDVDDGVALVSPDVGDEYSTFTWRLIVQGDS